MSSTLDPDNTPESDRQLGIGHGIGALGPSDISDSGSDVVGGPGLSHQVDLGLDRGTTSDPEESTAGFTAGPDVGDPNLDSDSDSGGTGERAAAGRDTIVPEGADRDADRIDIVDEIDNERTDADKAPTLSNERYRR